MALTLIGYRGSGKSSVGRVLASRLGWAFVDADEEIERRTGVSIASIFAEEGEDGFRRREAAVMEELLARERCVVAAGGGAVLSGRTRQLMAACGPVVYLRVSPTTAETRMKNDALSGQRRPALTGLPVREEIETLMTTREPLYRECATIAVEADARTVDEIIEEIFQSLPADLRPEEGR